MKKMLLILTILLVGFSAIAFFTAQAAVKDKVIAYYFRGTFRSPSCRHLEKNCRGVIETSFRDALASGKLEFQVVILGDKGEGYYANYYKIYARTLILSLVKDGKEIEWKNLDRIGEFFDDREGFSEYLKKEINIFLGKAE
ncbi:MAG: nitrophenyl compound nitroreductase subunit ArsF family protein [Candidatus Omnitrophica bacterium]|nr:nitrophenyl compound nitroreductase subunit ArsF family protein [Candidatus Omnitrophota bacterium]